MKLRNLILKLHRYIGVLVGVLLVIITLSGSSLVFATDIDAWLSPQIFRVTPQTEQVSIDSVIKTVQATYPNHKVVDILLPKTPDGVYRIMADDYKFSIYANPYTGKLGVAELMYEILQCGSSIAPYIPCPRDPQFWG